MHPDSYAQRHRSCCSGNYYNFYPARACVAGVKQCHCVCICVCMCALCNAINIFHSFTHILPQAIWPLYMYIRTYVLILKPVLQHGDQPQGGVYFMRLIFCSLTNWAQQPWGILMMSKIKMLSFWDMYTIKHSNFHQVYMSVLINIYKAWTITQSLITTSTQWNRNSATSWISCVSTLPAWLFHTFWVDCLQCLLLSLAVTPDRSEYLEGSSQLEWVR